jgi:predicted ATP-grasp superfamily ATP-dependent carboligase
MTLNASAPVVVLQLWSDPLHYGVLGVTRTLGRLGVPVYLVAPDERAPTARSRFTAATFAWNGLPANGGGVVDFLRNLAERLGERALLIPIDDLGPLVLDEHANELSEYFTFQRQPAGLVRALTNKRQMSRLAREHGIATPAIEMPASDADVERFLEHSAMPVVLKGAESFLPGSGERADLLIASTPEEVRRAYRSMSAGGRANLMLQEYIPGGPDSQWMFNGYFNTRSECLVAFTGRKLRQFPPYTGATSLGVCETNPEVEQMTIRFMREIGYHGVLDLGYRYDERDGQYKLLDVNPRVGSTFRLFVDRSTGLDVVRALYLDLTGQAVPPAAVHEGRRWVVEPRDLLSSLTYGRDGRLSARGWLTSFRGVEEAAWFARDDLRPLLGLARRAGRAAVRRGVEKIRRS